MPLSNLISFPPLQKLKVRVGVVDHSGQGKKWTLGEFVRTRKRKFRVLPVFDL
jgi:hypothetical protein